MTSRLLGSWLLTLPILPLFAASANASSITCYGSIVITTLGTEGMAINVPDGAIIQPNDPGAGSGFTVDAGSGATIRPVNKPLPSDAPKASGGGSGGSGGSNAPVSSPMVTAASSPTDDVDIVDGAVPVATPPIPLDDLPTFPVDVPPGGPKDPLGFDPTLDTPLQTAISTTGAGNVSDTPEPATLTLLGLAGVGGWFKLRRRK